MKNKAFTLIELILYIGIVTIVLSFLISFAWNMIISSTKNSVKQEVSSTARYISERLKKEIRQSSRINIGASNFDVNLAGSPLLQLSLINISPNNPTVFNIVAGQLLFTQGLTPAVALNSQNTKISNLTFSNYSSIDGKTKHLLFTITVESNYPSSAQQYSESISLESSSELRIN